MTTWPQARPRASVPRPPMKPILPMLPQQIICGLYSPQEATTCHTEHAAHVPAQLTAHGTCERAWRHGRVQREHTCRRARACPRARPGWSMTWVCCESSGSTCHARGVVTAVGWRLAVCRGARRSTRAHWHTCSLPGRGHQRCILGACAAQDTGSAYTGDEQRCKRRARGCSPVPQQACMAARAQCAN